VKNGPAATAGSVAAGVNIARPPRSVCAWNTDESEGERAKLGLPETEGTAADAASNYGEVVPAGRGLFVENLPSTNHEIDLTIARRDFDTPT
jgi:hypothetical protein